MMRVLLPLLWLGGCVINGDKFLKPIELTDTWKVDKTRVLGVRAEPAEARPGDLVTFQALIGAPPDDTEETAIVWLACPTDAGGGFGCALDLGEIDFETADPAALAELGFIGFEPGLPPAYLVPDDLLAGITDEQERLEGIQVLIQTTVFPLSILEEQVAELDFNEVEASFKRLVVSEATTPNANPALSAFTVDDLGVLPDAVVHVEPTQEYDLAILLQDGARQQYEFLNSSGVVEERVEEPYTAWFATGGQVTEEVTLWPFMESTWISPDRSGTRGTWYAVVRDRRGGMSWWQQDWVVD